MRDFYIILAKLGWGWVALLAVIWVVVASLRWMQDRERRRRGFEVEVQPTERHEEHR